MITDNVDDIKMKCKSLDKASTPRMMKYELTNVLGLRIEQLNFGSKTLLDKSDLDKCNSIADIANKELEVDLLPYIIQRQICDKKNEYFKLKDMIVYK